jgi:thioredoxin 1
MKKLLHFSAPSWCVPCQKTQPIVDSFISNNQDIEYKYVDVDKEPQLSSEYQVLGVPTFIFYRDGKQVNRHIGVITESQLGNFFN